MKRRVEMLIDHLRVSV